MFFFKRIILTSCLLAFQFKLYSSFNPTINVLTTMHTLDPKIVSAFEAENKVNVRVDFVGSRNEFENRLRSGLRAYDIVIADERVLERLSLEKLLRSLPDEDKSKTDNDSYPLYKRSKLNEDGSSYLSLFVDPMGIAYLNENSTLPNPVDWDILIQTDQNPYWRQRVYLPPSYKNQFLLALLATKKELTPSSWFIPETTTKWLKQLRLQNANIDLPLELAFLGNKISAAVLFYSNYLHLKRVVPGLNFVVPKDNTYYDRVSVGWASNSVQEGMSKKFIHYLFKNRDSLAQATHLLPLETLNFRESETKNWILYEDDVPLPKRIDNILRDLSTSPNSPTL